MRIMHVSTRLILGGSQENTVLSCAGQADDGHQRTGIVAREKADQRSRVQIGHVSLDGLLVPDCWYG